MFRMYPAAKGNCFRKMVFAKRQGNFRSCRRLIIQLTVLLLLRLPANIVFFINLKYILSLLNLKSQKNKPQLAKKAHWGKIGKLLAF